MYNFFGLFFKSPNRSFVPFHFINEKYCFLVKKSFGSNTDTSLNMLMLQMSTRKGSTDIHEFDGRFLGLHAHYKVTSVIGHIFRCLFI